MLPFCQGFHQGIRAGFDAFFPLVSTAIIYFLFCLLLSWVLGRIAARIDIANRPRTIEGVEER